MPPSSIAPAAAPRTLGMSPALIVLTLALLLGIQPVTTDLYLPALPALTMGFGAPVAHAQLTLTALLRAFGVSQLVLGPLSDRFGRRPVLLASALGAAAGHAVAALALIVQSYPLLLIARFGTGLLSGNGSVARAMLADRLDGDVRLRAFSWLNGAFYMGWLCGPLLAGLSLAWGLTAPFWVAVGALLLMAALVALALPREAASTATSSWWQVARRQHSLNLLRHPELRTLFVVQLAYTCGLTAFYEFYPLWLVEVPRFGARGIAWMTAGLCALMTVTSLLLAGRPSAVAPLRRAAWHAFGVAAAVALVAVGNVWLGLAAIILCGIPNAFYNGIMPSWCAERFGACGQGAVMGLLSTIFCLANILMALAGAVLTLIDTRLVLLLGAALSAWAGWRLQGWGGRMAAPAAGGGAAKMQAGDSPAHGG